MVLDSSAIVAILLEERGYERLLDCVESAQVVLIGGPTLLETAMVLTARADREARSWLSEFLRRARADVVPFTEEHVDSAISAFRRFGRGRHPAALNFGDCMSYAVAAVADEPLLFVGDEFARTDITPA